MIRLKFPLFIVSAQVQFERRPWRESLPRISIRSLILGIAVLGVLMGLYVTMVEMPTRRQRFLWAERQIDRQLDLIRKAIDEAVKADQSVEERIVLDRASIEKEMNEARKWPESSEEYDLHMFLASQWETEIDKTSGQVGKRAKEAEAFRAREREIVEARKKISNNLTELERLAFDAEKPLETPNWKTMGLAHTLASLDLQTTLNPDLAQEVAILSAKEFFQEGHPGIDPDRYTILARGVNYDWDVSFVDPQTKQISKVSTHFSRKTVEDHLAKQAPRTKRNMLGLLWP